MRDKSSLDKIELAGFESVEEIRNYRGIRLNYPVKSTANIKNDKNEEKIRGLMLKTAVFAVIALSILVLRSIDTPLTSGVIAGIDNADQNTTIDEDIGKLKFVENTEGDISVSTDANVFVFPVEGKITAKFGEDGSEGISIETSQGANVINAVSGSVYAIEKNEEDLNGSIVTMKNEDGSEASYYGVSPAVQEGDTLDSGDLIGTLSGDVLKFEIYVNGEAVDPLSYMDQG
ncbi:MAG: M23 family metallopeptidase [Eubacteriales bacterium]